MLLYASEDPEITSLLRLLRFRTRSIVIKDNGIGFDSSFQKENF
jgi:hypothetical protein